MSSAIPSHASRVAADQLQRSKSPKPPVASREPSPDGSAHGQSAVVIPTPATAGDHPAIHRFLLSIFHAPSASEFHAQLEEPLYEPSDRLVLRQGAQIVAHGRMTRREMHFADLVLPIAGLEDLATMPEYRRQGCATAILREAERRMVNDGASLGMLRTKIPKFYANHGWIVCGRHCYSTSGPREILSNLSAQSADRDATRTPFAGRDDGPRQFNIRLWRHVEQAALTRLYALNTAQSFGPLIRNDAYWRWLVSRRGYERIYVAIHGPDKLELDESLSPIVAYAAVRDGRIVELMSAEGFEDAAMQLLGRACGDAIERDIHEVILHGPPDDRLHDLIRSAGGSSHYHEAERGEVFMVKLFDPLKLVGQSCHLFAARAKSGGLPPCELGLQVGSEKLRISVSRRSVRMQHGKLGRSYLTCSANELTQLVLGHVNVERCVEVGALEASTRVAVELASVLFPQLPAWHPPLDTLPAA